MMHEAEKYHLLTEEEDSEHELPKPKVPVARPSSFRSRYSGIIIGALLLASMIVNIILGVHYSASNPEDVVEYSDTTRWAKLARNVPKPIFASTEYGPAIGTLEQRDRLWNALDISPGSVLLSDDFALKNGLPLSQRFPWDQTKGVYLLGAYHQMHCLKNIYLWSSAMYQNKTPEMPYSHVSHCLDSLLQDVYCHADDTPWYQLPPEPYRQKYAQFQTRQCRSWDKLLKWSEDHDACYKYDNVTYADGSTVKTDQFEHYRFCREGSPYTTIMAEYFERHTSSGSEGPDRIDRRDDKK